ncbi:hypothetical protein [Bacillus changyiensis]|nr:hypothetical protein [Bacillus changyiensis]MDA1475426.1 hypothetical protein [Bacillus changyiensis]
MKNLNQKWLEVNSSKKQYLTYDECAVGFSGVIGIATSIKGVLAYNYN